MGRRKPPANDGRGILPSGVSQPLDGMKSYRGIVAEISKKGGTRKSLSAAKARRIQI